MSRHLNSSIYPTYKPLNGDDPPSTAKRCRSFPFPNGIVIIHRLCYHFPFRRLPPLPSLQLTSITTIREFSSDETAADIPVSGGKISNKPSICTVDELHYISVKLFDWILALWPYHPSPPIQSNTPSIYTQLSLSTPSPPPSTLSTPSESYPNKSKTQTRNSP